MKFPPLYAIANVDIHPDPLNYVRRLLSEGITLLQLRNKLLPKEVFLELARVVVEEKARFPTVRIIINDSPDICLAAKADGVHLGQEDMDPKSARRFLGSGAFLGFSTHNLHQAMHAPKEVLDYLALGPIFSSLSKSGHAPPVGLSILEKVCLNTSLPVVAIGGITEQNASDIFRSGARSLAVIHALESSGNLRKTIDRFESAALKLHGK